MLLRKKSLNCLGRIKHFLKCLLPLIKTCPNSWYCHCLLLMGSEKATVHRTIARLRSTAHQVRLHGLYPTYLEFHWPDWWAALTYSLRIYVRCVAKFSQKKNVISPACNTNRCIYFSLSTGLYSLVKFACDQKIWNEQYILYHAKVSANVSGTAQAAHYIPFFLSKSLDL